MQGADTDIGIDVGRGRQRERDREIVGAFLTAARGGSFDALLAVLDPNVVVRADDTAVKLGAAREVVGAAVVAKTFARRAAGARMALVDGVVGAVWVHKGKPRVVFGFTVADGKITAIDLAGDRTRLAALDLIMIEA